MPYATAEEIDLAHQTLTATFKSGKTKSLAWRKWQLKQIWWMLIDNKDRIASALYTDLHRHPFESHAVEFTTLEADILLHLSKLEEWSADEVPDGAGFVFGTLCHARIRREPLGVALVIGPWNFPVVLLLQPLIAAVTAGCCCILKPSELSVAAQDTVVDMVKNYLDPEAIQVLTGGAQETSKLLERRFDHIFYTGNPTIARIVQAAAAKHLTPTVLELGGQCPAVVTATADIQLAAKRIAMSKFANAGQICLSVNHVFVDPAVHDEFVSSVGSWMKEIMMSKENKDQNARIVNERHFDRIAKLLADSKGKVLAGGMEEMDRDNRFIPLTLLSDVSLSDSTMCQENFGPLLPVLKSDWRSACSTISSMEDPLGLYIFSNDQSEIDGILSRTSSGGVTINDLMIHATVPTAPFGGIGNSGMGYYHGKYGFESFSHKRTVVTVPAWLEFMLNVRYPPYTAAKWAKIPRVKSPGFKRDETMEDQIVGESAWKKGLVQASKTGFKWAFIAVAFALIDAKFGGDSKVVGLLRNARAVITTRTLS